MDARVLVFTARLRYEGPAIASVYAMLKASEIPCEWLQIDEQPHGRAGTNGTGNLNILHLLNLARARFLAGPYSHMLIVEDDMVLPEDALPRLLEARAPVTYGLYCWRRPPHFWNAYRFLHDEGGSSIIDDNPWEAQRAAREGRIIDVQGVGLGCTLLTRGIIEQIPWRLSRTGGRASCDWYFARDCGDAGVRQVAHLGVRCGHIATEPSARIIWPDIDGDPATKRLWRYAYYERGRPQ